jgi:hypothetical protein
MTSRAGGRRFFMSEKGNLSTLRAQLGFSLIMMVLYLLLFADPGTTNAAEPGAQVAVFPRVGAYCGAYVDFGETEDNVTLEAIEKFEKLAGKHLAIIASSSFWGELNFPVKNVMLISRHGALPLLFWSPWDRPYAEEAKPDRFGLKEILSGKWDSYIDQWAIAARETNIPLLVSWGMEMNGNWFPWSGIHYGGGTEGKSGFEGPESYKKAFRYVVDRVRARGATNILWGFHANYYTYPWEAWNRISQYYPGADYVDWLGLSVYGKQFSHSIWYSFKDVMEEGYQELCNLDPVKPVLVAEYGVGEFPSSGNKAEWITNALELLRTRYTRVKGAVYWQERWPNDDGTYTNLRINSSPEALAAYRKGIANPFWLDWPQYTPRKPDFPGRRAP